MLATSGWARRVPTRAVDTAKQITGLPADKITIHNHLLGGGFGRRLETDFIAQALKIGKQVDAPVKVTFTREEDIQHDMYRPYYYDVISAGLDANGKPIAWKHRIVGSSVLARFAPPAIKNGVDPDAVEVAADLPYDLPNQLVDYVRQEPRDIPTAFWRGGRSDARDLRGGELHRRTRRAGESRSGRVPAGTFSASRRVRATCSTSRRKPPAGTPRCRRARDAGSP